MSEIKESIKIRKEAYKCKIEANLQIKKNNKTTICIQALTRRLQTIV